MYASDANLPSDQEEVMPNPNSTGNRLRRLGYAARKAKIGRSLRRFGAKPPISGELPVRGQVDGQFC